MSEHVLRPRASRRARGCDRVLDLLQRIGVEPVEIGLVQQRRTADLGAENLDAVPLGTQAIKLALAAIALRITFEVAEEALRIELDRRRAVAGYAHVFEHFAKRIVHREEVGAVTAPDLHAERLGAAGDVASGAHRIVDAGVLGIVVVLEHEDRRRLGDDGQVHRLEGGTLIAGAVPRKRDGDRQLAFRIWPVDLVGDRRTHRDRRARADNAVGAQHALVDVGDVHGAALAVAQAFLASPDLLHHPFDIAALGEAMAVAAMGRDDLVSVGQMLANAHRDGFLPAIKVGETGDLAALDLFMKTFLEFADQLHLPVGAG